MSDTPADTAAPSTGPRDTPGQPAGTDGPVTRTGVIAPDPATTGGGAPERSDTGRQSTESPENTESAGSTGRPGSPENAKSGRSTGSPGAADADSKDDAERKDDTESTVRPARPAGRWVRRPAAALAAQGSSWFRIGFGLGLGAVLAWLLVQTVLQISELLTLLLLSFFIAVSLEPAVALLCRLGLRRGWSVAAVLVAFAGVLAGFVALVIPPVTAAVNALSNGVPRWRDQLHDHHSTLGRLEDHYHVIEKVQAQLGSGGASQVAGGVLGAGQMVISLVTSTVIVITVTLYVMAALPAIKRFGYRFVPGTRRDRVESVTEEILSRVGRYMLGNIATSAIAGVATFVWCEAIGVPYPAALGFFVALMDMVPVVGSTVGGVVVSLVALAASLPVAIATAVFYVGFRVAEDYLIMPRAMKFAVDVHPVVTVVAVLAGGSLLGIIGGLVAIPAAVALGIVLDEYVFPRTDAS